MTDLNPRRVVAGRELIARIPLRRMAVILACLLLALLGARPGSALAQSCASALVCDSNAFYSTATDEFSLVASTRENLEITVSDLHWPQSLSVLDLYISTPGSTTPTLIQAAGTTISTQLQVGPGAFYANLIADADPTGALLPDLGAFSLLITVQPAISSVPLPAAGPLLLGALLLGALLLGALWWHGRARLARSICAP
ncbi:MAG TPA: hypothetical protein VME21_04875 [Steroidobacteraceae bacterium]|nr:hypothetical protein [Steroidobacteraceae bacterium]